MAPHRPLKSKSPHRYAGHSFDTIPEQMCDTMHWSKDDEDIQRERERAERECVLTRMDAYTSCDGTGWKFLQTLRYHTALQNFLEKKGSNQNAPPKEAQKSPHSHPPTGRAQNPPVGGGRQVQEVRREERAQKKRRL